MGPEPCERIAISPDWSIVAACGGTSRANWEVSTGTGFSIMRAWD